MAEYPQEREATIREAAFVGECLSLTVAVDGHERGRSDGFERGLPNLHPAHDARLLTALLRDRNPSDLPGLRVRVRSDEPGRWWVVGVVAPQPERFEAVILGPMRLTEDGADALREVRLTDGRIGWATSFRPVLHITDRVLVEAGDPWRIVEVLGRDAKPRTFHCDRCDFTHINHHRDDCDCAERGIPAAEPPKPALIVAGRRYRPKDGLAVLTALRPLGAGGWAFSVEGRPPGLVHEFWARPETVEPIPDKAPLVTKPMTPEGHKAADWMAAEFTAAAAALGFVPDAAPNYPPFSDDERPDDGPASLTPTADWMKAWWHSLGAPPLNLPTFSAKWVDLGKGPPVAAGTHLRNVAAPGEEPRFEIVDVDALDFLNGKGRLDIPCRHKWIKVDRYAMQRGMETSPSAAAWMAAQSGTPLPHRCPHCEAAVTYHGARAGGRTVCPSCRRTVGHG